MQKPKISQGKKFLQKLSRKAKSIFTGLKKTDAGFWAYSPFSLPAYHLRFGRAVNNILLYLQISGVSKKLGLHDPIVWVACPVACDIALKMNKARLVYQRTDRYEDDPGVDKATIQAYDRTLKTNADITIYVSRALYDEEHGQCRRALFLDHGVDYETFASAEQNQYVPFDIATIKKPIVGYFGELADHKVDLQLTEQLTKLLPDFSFVFVGDVPQNFRDKLDRENVWILGKKPYEQIPHYGKRFDVAILPWKKNRWTEAANPIKLKEYLALGKPVISTPAFTEVQNYLDVVYVADNPAEFAQSIKVAFIEDSQDRIAARRKKVAQASWDSKAKLVLEELFAKTQAPPRIRQ
jgi:glycosyltransferase involved in cell wall biosynthesis